MASIFSRVLPSSQSPTQGLTKILVRHRYGGRFKGVVQTTNEHHGGNKINNTYTYEKFIKEHAIEQINKEMVKFPFVQKVKTWKFHQFAREEFKIRYIHEDSGNKDGVELLQNITNKRDSWMIRKDMSLCYYYRLEMIQQRLDYLKNMKMLPEEKLANIRAQPPLLMFSFDSEEKKANLMYLRGLVRDDHGDLADNLPTTQSEYLHIFYPITREISLTRRDLTDRLFQIGDELELKQFSILEEVMRIPCFFMDPALMTKIKSLFVHRFSMPFLFDIDHQTMPLLPPILNLRKLNLDPEEYFSHHATRQKLEELPLYEMKEVLDYSYRNLSQFQGTPAFECMSKFMIRAEKEEAKDRFNGQAIGGRRGFNVPARQY